MSLNHVNSVTYGDAALLRLHSALVKNQPIMERLASRVAQDVREGKSLFAFGSGHSSIFPMELFHRAGGASFVVPVVADFLLPTAGPPVVRILERTPGLANILLARVQPRSGEMIWIFSQSGINAAGIDIALDAKKRGMYCVAFTSVPHSSSVQSRHPSGKRLFEICDETVDLGGEPGDAIVSLSENVKVGPLSSLASILLANSVIVAATAQLEASGHRCVYTSVNTGNGENRNRTLEIEAAKRDPLLREP